MKRKFYSYSYWYINTYNALGSSWLIESIKKLKPRKNFLFLNLSANAAYYERDTYEALKKEYEPVFYVGDISGSELKNENVTSYGDFHYLEDDYDAYSKDVLELGIKADVILDCKGALWYSLSNYEKENLINVLTNYYDLMSDDGVLLIDLYKLTQLECTCNALIWLFKRANKANKKVKRFGEASTYLLLCNVFGRRYIKNILHKLEVSNTDKDKNLANYMNTAYINKSELKDMIDKVKSFRKGHLAFCSLRRNGLRFLFNLGIVSIVLAIVVLIIIGIVIASR